MTANIVKSNPMQIKPTMQYMLGVLHIQQTFV